MLPIRHRRNHHSKPSTKEPLRNGSPHPPLPRPSRPIPPQPIPRNQQRPPPSEPPASPAAFGPSKVNPSRRLYLYRPTQDELIHRSLDLAAQVGIATSRIDGEISTTITRDRLRRLFPAAPPTEN